MVRLLLLIGLCPTAVAGSLSGRVNDPAGAAVPQAEVTLRSGVQAVVRAARTDDSGAFRLEQVAGGLYLLTVRREGFAEATRTIQLSAGDARTEDFTLSIGVVSTQVSVSAESMTPLRVNEAAQFVNIINAESIRERSATTLTDALQDEPGVTPQRTVPSMGGTFIRGLTGKNVSVYRDGVRYTTSAQRGGVSTFFNMINPAALETVEVLRGPSSGLYGSDSLAGTLSATSKPVAFTSSTHGEIEAMYTSAAHSPALAARFTTSGSRWGLAMDLAALRNNTLRTGQGIDSHAAVTRFLGLPSTILGDRNPDTAFTQYGGSWAGDVALTANHRLSARYERSQQDGVKRSDQLLGGDGNLIADIRNLMLDFAYLRYSGKGFGLFDESSATLSYNAQREERVNQGGQGNPASAIQHQYEKTHIWGASMHAVKRLRTHTLVAGADGYRERAAAPAFNLNPVNGVSTIVRGRIPDNVLWRSYGFFLQEAWAATSRLRLSGVLRYGGASYRSTANALRLWPDDSLAVARLSGRAGVTYRVLPSLSLVGGFGQGFRAPNMTDLGTLGLQGNGAFEAAIADLAGRSAIIGNTADDRAVSTGQPAQRLKPEFTNNYDFGLRVERTHFTAEASGFVNTLMDTIISQTLILPAGAVGSQLGSERIVRQLPTGAVYVGISNAPVQIRTNFSEARLYGFEQRLAWRITSSWSVRQNVSWTYAEDPATGRPPDIEGGIPPLTFVPGIRYTKSRWWTELYGVAARKQSRLSTLALSDRRIGAPRTRAQIASFFRNGARVRGLITATDRLMPTGETVEQVQDRVLGTANSAPLFSYVPGYVTAGFRAGARIGESSDVLIDFSNMFDRNYRGLSWGVDGAGRSIAIRVRRRF